MIRSSKTWLFVRGPESVRIVIDGTAVAVYGPGPRFSHSHFGEAIDATLHQADVEQALVLDGWTLEQLTTERRVPSPPAPKGFGVAERRPERRGALRLVRDHGDAPPWD